MVSCSSFSAREKPNLNLEVIVLPKKCDDPAFVQTLNEQPGILALAMDRKIDPVTKQVKLEACPFIVPGARFNEKYGWDSVSLVTWKLRQAKVL
jgi:alpha,alpha-trehalase